MTDQTQNQLTEMEEKAKFIGRKLKRLQRKSAEPTEQVHFMNEMILF